MELLKDFPLKDIIISEDYAATTPKQYKQKRKEEYYEKNGELPEDIIINDENVLVDGYTTYLLALKTGIQSVDAYRGYIEVIEASHREKGKVYTWRVPGRLMGMLQNGEKCVVRTEKGVCRVVIKNIIRQQYPTQVPRMKYVIRCDRRTDG